MWARATRNLSRHVAPVAGPSCLSQSLPFGAVPVPREPPLRPTRHARFASNQPQQQQQHHAIAGPSSSPKGKPKPPAHKPPRRRLEAASQPLRNAPSSSRGPVLQCIAHTTAERYDLPALGLVLRDLGVKWDEVPEGDRDQAIVIGPWKGRGGAERIISGKDVRGIPTGAEEEDSGVYDDPNDFGFQYGERGEIWIFSNGSFVTWGLTEEEGRAFLWEVIRRRGSRVEVEVERLKDKAHEVEEVDFVVDPAATTHILGNLILLGRPPELSTFPPSPSLASLLTRYTLSFSLSRSSALSVLEQRLDSHIASVSKIPAELERMGVQPMKRREVIRKMGELMSLRMAVNTRGGGLDETPDFYWSEPELEAYFDSIASEFEIKERVDTLNQKIDYAQEIQSNLRALLTEASGHRMELIIIALIAVEVVIVLIREGHELFDNIVYPVLIRIRDLTNLLGAATEVSKDKADEAALLNTVGGLEITESGLSGPASLGIQPQPSTADEGRIV